MSRGSQIRCRNFVMADRFDCGSLRPPMSVAFVTFLALQGAVGPVDGESAEPEAAVAAPTPAPAPQAAEPAVVAAQPVVEAQPVTRAPGTFSAAQIGWINRRWSGVGVGYDNGIWGGKFGQSIKVMIPFGRDVGRFVGLRVRGAMVHHVDDAMDQFDPVINAGVEFIGRSPVWWGVLRVYGGGGAWAGIRPNPTSLGAQYRIGGGGFFGFEAFAAHFMAFTLEVGGQAPGHGLGIDGGGSVMGGMMFYFGRNEARWGQGR